jgi:BRCT domain type II-containing protein
VYYVYYFSTRFTKVQITVKNDFIKANGKYSANMIGATDGEVYKISSNMLIGFFVSSEVLATLEEGKTFLISGYGKRVSMLGMYPMITDAIPR